MCAISADDKTVRLAGLVTESVVDGPGLRLTIFTQGCPHRCPGCHNPETHTGDGGYDLPIAELLRAYAANPLLSGVTFSGGEPFCQPEPLACLAAAVHELGGDIVTYTGYYLEQLLELAHEDGDVGLLLKNTDILIDGPFVQESRSLDLPFRGSRNQRLIYNSEFANLLA